MLFLVMSEARYRATDLKMLPTFLTCLIKGAESDFFFFYFWGGGGGGGGGSLFKAKYLF